MQFAILEKSLGHSEKRDAMRWDRMDLRATAHTVVEKRSEIIDTIATEASPFDGVPPTKGRSTILSITLVPFRPLASAPFFRKITHGGHLFVCSVRLLGPCSEIDRRLRPTDVCSAATALTFAPPQKYHLASLSPLSSSSPPSSSRCIGFLLAFFQLGEQVRVR